MSSQSAKVLHPDIKPENAPELASRIPTSPTCRGRRRGFPASAARQVHIRNRTTLRPAE